MKYLILSPIALSMFIVPRLAQSSEVEKVYFCTLDSGKKKTGKGMEQYPGWEKFELVNDFHEVLNKESKKDLVIFIDDIGIGQTGDNLRKQGYNVIGGSVFTDRIEDDRQYATDLMSRIMDVPPSTSFTSWEEVFRFIKAHEESDILVFKPNDAEVPKEYTYVGKKGTKELLQELQDFRAEWKWKEDFQIQEGIKGQEIDFSAYFNGKEYIPNSLVYYFENKAFMNDDIGAATGGSIAVEIAHKSEGPFWDILQKFKPALKKSGYVGQISLNSIVSEEDHKPYFLEFCGRVGYPSFPLDITLIEEKGKSLHDLFMAMVKGETPENLFDTDKIAVTVSLFVPPAPLEVDMESFEGTPMTWDKKWDRYFFPYYIMKEEKKQRMVLAGTSTWIGQCTCADRTLDGAISMMYDDYMSTLQLKNVEYRTDCGKSAKKRMQKLHEWGVI